MILIDRPGHRPDPLVDLLAPYRQGLPAGAGGGLGIYLPPTIGMTLVVGAISWPLGKCPEEACGGGWVDEEAYAEEP